MIEALPIACSCMTRRMAHRLLLPAIFLSTCCCFIGPGLLIGDLAARESATDGVSEHSEPPAARHPNTSADGWRDLFAEDLSNAEFPKGKWAFDDGVLTASDDIVIWSDREYANFILDLEFKNASGTNSGVIVYATDVKNWPANSVEVQIADDFHETWANSPKNYQCGAIFGHVDPSASFVKKPGEWNRMTIFCRGRDIRVVLNGQVVSTMDMSEFTNVKINPDGSKVPSWLSRPKSEMKARGLIGLQGKHHGVPIYFRNVRVNEL